MSSDKYDELHDHIMAPAREYLASCKSGMVCHDDESEEGQSVFKITRLQADLVVARRELADLREENKRLSGEVGDLRGQLHKTFDDWVKVRKMAIIWHKWPEEKPVREKAYLICLSRKWLPRFAVSRYYSLAWSIKSRVDVTHWAEIPVPEES